MTKQGSKAPSLKFTTKAILNLGEHLASLTSCQEQKAYLLDFLQNRFGEKVFINIIESHEDVDASQLPKNCPVDIHNTINHQKYRQNHYWMIEEQENNWLIVSLAHGADEIGVMILGFETHPPKSTIDALVGIGQIAGLAIYGSLQTHLQQWQQKQLALVHSVTAQVSQITDQDILTKQIVQLVQQSFNYYYVAVFLINDETKRLQFKDSASSTESEKPDFERPSHPGFALGEHIIGHVAKTGCELIANDVKKEQRYKEVNSLADTKSEVVLPLRIETHIFGVFDVQSNRLNAFTEEDLLVLRSLADNIAIAIENTRLIQTAQQRANQLTAVGEASRAITSILDFDALLQRIVNLIRDRFNFPFVHLYTIDHSLEKIIFKAGSGQRSPLYTESSISFDVNAITGVIPWVVQHGQTKRINDVEKEPLFVEPPFTEQTSGSEMTIPLNFGGEILGVLDIQSKHKQAFSQEEQQLMETLGDNIAISIHNARLYRSEKWRRQVAESLRDVAGLLSDYTELGEVLDAILQQLLINLPCDVACVWLFNQDSSSETPIELRELNLAAYSTDEKYPPDELEAMSFKPDAWVKAALTNEQPKIRKPDETIGPIAVHFKMDKHYSAIAAPLHTGDEILGMLTLTHHDPGRYGWESENITTAFASYAAIAIKNARLFTQSQEQAWISTILLQVAQATQSQSSIEGLAETIVRLTPMVIGVEGCAIFLLDEESQAFSLQAMYGFADSDKEVDLNLPLSLPNAPILNKLKKFNEIHIVKNAKEDFNLPEEYSKKMCPNTMVLLPLIARDRLLGALLISNDTDNTPTDIVNEIIPDEKLKIVQGIIQQTAIGIENLRLLETRQEEAYISTVLLQVSQAVVSNTELNDTLDSIVNIMSILVGIESSVIYFWDKTEKRFITSFATVQGPTEQEELIGTTYEESDFPMLDAVYHNNHPVVFPFTETILPAEDWDLILPDEGQIDPITILQSRYPLLLGFPLSVKDEVFGVLLAQDENIATNRERRFELLWGIAQQASLAIQNNQLNKEMLDRQRLEREFQLAREIQQTFLPSQMPEMSGWDMDVRWEPARQVGGDFYDYFLLPDGRLAFLIADVSDKGLAASLYMTVTRTLLRAAALESTSPAETMEHVNELLLANSQKGLFVTTFYGILDLQNGNLTYAIAGHNPPLLLRFNQKEIEEIEKGGIALGAMADINLCEDHIQINPGDCLFLYTDGVTEAFNFQDQMYGNERLNQILNTVIGEPAAQVLQAVEVDLDSFRGEAPLSDDTTMLAIYRAISLADKNGEIRTSQNPVDRTPK